VVGHCVQSLIGLARVIWAELISSGMLTVKSAPDQGRAPKAGHAAEQARAVLKIKDTEANRAAIPAPFLLRVDKVIGHPSHAHPNEWACD
jgi:hypothetical protein